MSEARTEAGRDLLAHIQLLYDRVESPSSSDVATFYGRVAGIEAESLRAIEDSTGNLIIAFRRYCFRTYGSVPSEDDFRAILRDAAVPSVRTTWATSLRVRSGS
jgi:hypothetical protein